MKTIQRTAAVILAVCLLFGCVPAVSAAAVRAGKAGPDAVWQLSDEGVLTVTGSGRIYDYFVDSDPYLSEHKGDIFAICIEDGITAVGDNAFYECTNAQTVDLPGSLTSFGRAAFSFCLSLRSVDIPEGVTVLPTDLFFSDFSIEQIKLPKNLKKICWQALLCGSLTSLRIPAGVESIEAAAFYGAGLKYIFFEGSEQQWNRIVDPTYNDCLKTAKIFFNYTDANPVVLEEGNCGDRGDNLKWKITSDGVITVGGTGKMKDYYQENGSFPSHPWSFCPAYDSVKTIVIEEGVTSVTDYAFCGTYAEKAILANSLQIINGAAFIWNGTIREINIPDSLAADCLYICSELSALERITVSPNCKNYYADENGALFSKAYHMLVAVPCKCTAVRIPADVTEVIVSAFQNNAAIERISVESGNPTFSVEQGVLFRREGDNPLHTLVYCPAKLPAEEYTCPADTKTIGSHAFVNGQTLKKIVLTDAVTEIGDYAFYCSRAQEIVLPKKVDYMGNVCFYGCTELRSVNLPEGAYSLYFMFSYCFSLESAILPESVRCIDEAAFTECCSLTEVNIPSGVTEIESCAFRGCESLSEVILPAGLETIGGEAFRRCGSLQYVVFLGDDVDMQMSSFDIDLFMDQNGNTFAKGPETLTLVCDSGSSAEEYAQEYRIKTVPLHWNGHVYIPDVSVPPACTLPGKTEGAHCLECGEILKEQTEIPAAGHKWGYGKITKEPTETETGIRTFTCTVCGETKTETIDVIFNGPGTPEVQPYSGGDPDGDGRITAADARLALRKSVGLENFAEGSPAFIACDVDRDGRVTAADARLILRASVGVEDPKKF